MSVPYKIEPFSKEENEEMLKSFKAAGSSWIKVGKDKISLPKSYEKLAAGIYNCKLRPDDIWTGTIPRSGTTVTQEIIWCIMHNLDFEAAKSKLLLERFPEIDQSSFFPAETLKNLYEDTKEDKEAQAFLDAMCTNLLPLVENMPGQRFIKSHVKMELLPPNLIDTCKVFYVCRYPKDVIVSYFHFNRMFNFCWFTGDFATFFDLFRRNLLPFSDYWQHVGEAWKLKDHPNMCFLFYEEVIRDQKNAIKKIASHLGRTVSDDDIKKLMDHVHVDNFRNNKSVNLDDFPFLYVPGREDTFIRKGKTGGWKDYFTPDINAVADKWIKENKAKLPGFKFFGE